MNLLEELSKAAARGVEVTIITNQHTPAPLTLKWAQVVKNWGAIVTFQGAGYELTVIDCDGDYSTWTLYRHGKLIVEGTINSYEPYYHCDAACLAAEEALRLHARARLAELRGAVMSRPHQEFDLRHHELAETVRAHLPNATIVSIVSINDRMGGQMILGDPSYDKAEIAARLRLCADILTHGDGQ